jgi:hypothetical protein
MESVRSRGLDYTDLGLVLRRNFVIMAINVSVSLYLLFLTSYEYIKYT